MADLPIGGTTGLSHEHSAAIDEAAAWLVSTPRHLRRATYPELRERFGLSPKEACDACAVAEQIRRAA